MEWGRWGITLRDCRFKSCNASLRNHIMYMWLRGMDLNGFRDDFALNDLWFECLVICYFEISNHLLELHTHIYHIILERSVHKVLSNWLSIICSSKQSV